MYISTKKKFIFIHIPKAAGISIASALKEADKDETFRTDLGGTKHYSLILLNKYIQKNGYDFNLDDFYKFAFVRNSWDRLLSAFFWRPKKHKEKALSFPSYIEDIYANLPEKRASTWSFKPQLDYIINKDGKVIMDFIGRFERLEEDFKKVCDKLDLNPRLHRKNATTHNNYRKYYTKRSKRLVGEMFKQDIDYFGFEF